MKATNRCLWSILLMCISVFVNAQTLNEFLIEASENNPGLKSRYAEFEAAMQRVAQLNSLPDPNLSFGYFISPVETRLGPQQVKFSLTQMFPWFGTLEAKGEVVTLMAQSKFQEFLNARNKLFYEVKAAWYPLYEVNKLLRIQDENLDILYVFKKLATSEFKNSQGSMVDVIRTEVMIEKAETDIKLLVNKKRPLLTQFNLLVNRDDTAQVDIPDSIAIDPIAEGYRLDSMFVLHPMLESFRLRQQSASAQEKVALKQGLPSIGVGVDYIVVGKGSLNVPESGRDIVMPMFTMNLPIFRRKYKASMNEARLTQNALELARDELENNLKMSYELTWYELDRSFSLIQLFDDQISKTQIALDLLIKAYRNSGNEYEEILRMQQELLGFQTEKAIQVTHYLTSLAKLDYLTSKSE